MWNPMPNTYMDISQVMSCAQKVWRSIGSRKLTNITALLLACITFGYLLETRNQRLLLEKTVAVETQPRVYVKNVVTNAKMDLPNSKIIINTKFVLSNCGKTEARNIRLSYVISQGTQVVKNETYGPYQYMYPDQNFTASIENLEYHLSEEEMEIAKKAVELDVKFGFFGKIQNPPLLKIELVYEDAGGQLAPPVSYVYRYVFSMEVWVYQSQKGENKGSGF